MVVLVFHVKTKVQVASLTGEGPLNLLNWIQLNRSSLYTFCLFNLLTHVMPDTSWRFAFLFRPLREQRHLVYKEPFWKLGPCQGLVHLPPWKLHL